jgi:hypothetical protein
MATRHTLHCITATPNARRSRNGATLDSSAIFGEITERRSSRHHGGVNAWSFAEIWFAWRAPSWSPPCHSKQDTDSSLSRQMPIAAAGIALGREKAGRGYHPTSFAQKRFYGASLLGLGQQYQQKQQGEKESAHDSIRHIDGLDGLQSHRWR